MSQLRSVNLKGSNTKISSKGKASEQNKEVVNQINRVASMLTELNRQIEPISSAYKKRNNQV